MTGATPLFLTAGAVSRMGGVPPGVMPGVTPHLGSLPSGCIPAGRLTDPHAGRTDRRREARNGRSTAPRLSGDRRRQCRGRVDMTKRVSRGRSRGGPRPRSHVELLPRRRRVVRPRARRGRLPRRAIARQYVTDWGRPDGRQSVAPVPAPTWPLSPTADAPASVIGARDCS